VDHRDKPGDDALLHISVLSPPSLQYWIAAFAGDDGRSETAPRHINDL
jgi:hypothetical protein